VTAGCAGVLLWLCCQWGVAWGGTPNNAGSSAVLWGAGVWGVGVHLERLGVFAWESLHGHGCSSMPQSGACMS
jgi:hypothetical protein